jgi:hypothetical protein
MSRVSGVSGVSEAKQHFRVSLASISRHFRINTEVWPSELTYHIKGAFAPIFGIIRHL